MTNATGTFAPLTITNVETGEVTVVNEHNTVSGDLVQDLIYWTTKRDEAHRKSQDFYGATAKDRRAYRATRDDIERYRLDGLWRQVPREMRAGLQAMIEAAR